MSIYFLIAICIFLVIAIILGIFTKTVISKRAIWYSGPLFAYMLLIYLVGYKYQFGSVGVGGLFNCIVAGLKSFTFEVNNSYISNILAADLIYKIAFYMGVACAGLTLVFGALELVKATLHNDFRRVIRLIRCKADIVLGYNEDAIRYCKSNKNTVLWIDSTIIKLSKEEKLKLYQEEIIYIYAPFNAKKLLRVTKFVFKNLYIITFHKNNEFLPIVLKTLEELKPSKKEIEFHVQSKSSQLSFVNEQLTKRCIGKDNVMAVSFDYYELISRMFSLEHNLAKYLPKGFIEDGVVAANKNINVVMLGFGKTAKAILKSIIVNNQFVEIVDGKYQAKKINVELYDVNEESFDDSMVTHITHFNELCKKDYFNFDSQMGPVELAVNIAHKKCNVKTDTSEEFLNSLIRNDDDFTFYVISLTDSAENSMMADALSKTINLNSSVIFYNVDNKNEVLLTKVKNIIPFGFKSEILSHQNITVEDICSLARMSNEAYNEKSGRSIDFYQRPIIEKLSNQYKEINLRFKLNLVGLDYTLDDVVGLSKEEFEKHYPKHVVGNYQEYFTINLRNALIYQEHLRWVMYYFMNDYKGMKLSEIQFDGEKVVHKNIEERRHACLTSFNGIDILHRYELQIYLDNKKDKTIDDVETYKYDMELDRAYDDLSKLGYKIIKLR